MEVIFTNVDYEWLFETRHTVIVLYIGCLGVCHPVELAGHFGVDYNRVL